MDFRIIVDKNVEPFVRRVVNWMPVAGGKKKEIAKLTRWTSFGLQLHIY